MAATINFDAGAEFSYACTRCNRCCAGKLIQVNPYEIARLAGRLRLSTAEFRDRFTDGARLNRDKEGRCVFLGSEGCSVHSDRPLVCRLFPLGRVVDEDGVVTYCRPNYDRGASGEFGTAATVADYVEAQGAAPFIEAADAYFAVYCKARRSDPAALETAAESRGDLLDLDTQVARWCGDRGLDVPRDIEERRRLHVGIISEIIEAGGCNATT